MLPSGRFGYAASFEASLIVWLFCFLGAFGLLGHTAPSTYHHLPLAYCMLLSGGYLLGVYRGCYGVSCMQVPRYWGEGDVVTGIYHHPSCAGAWVRTD